jgi:hypothetical protein
MDNSISQEPPEEFGNDLELLMSLFAGFVWRGMTAQQAVEQIAQYGADMAPDIAAGIDPRAGVTDFFRLLGRSLWNATPQPAHGFKLIKLPQPGRNDPCFCGSGRKYKQCCSGMPEFPVEPALMLDKLLGVMPRKHWANLAHSQVNREWVMAVAYQWLQDGEAEQVACLLEPWFKGEDTIRDQDGDLLDLLLDAYADLDKPRKRKGLAVAATQRGERYARYIGWQRLALMEMDAGNLAASHAALKEAMRAEPDDPSLGPLEVTLLMAENKHQLARERARFWHGKMARLRDPELKVHMDWLQAVVDNPQTAMFNTVASGDHFIGELDALMANAPQPQCHYRLEPMEQSTGPFQPDSRLGRALDDWAAAFPVNKPFSTQMTSYNEQAWEDPGAWLEVLRERPELWHSFEALDDLVCALDAYGAAGVAEVLVPRLTSRAGTLFDLVLEANQASGLKCEWGWMENRPALRLLARCALDGEHAADADSREAAFKLMRRLVEQLNPNDNHGLRARVAAGLVERGLAEAAVALADKYPDDLADMQFNRILALYAAGRLEEAAQAARQNLVEYPKVGKMLLAKSPRQPRLDAMGYKIGSDQEAWLYREDFLPTWQSQQGALEWLHGLARKS